MPDVDDELEAPKPSMMPIVLAAVGALVVGAGAGFGAAMLIPGGATSAEAAEAEVPEEPLEVEGPDGEMIVIEDPSRPFTHDLGKFTLNLRGGGGGRTLRMQVQVATTARHQLELEERNAALRDAVLTLASDYTYGDVEGLDGKQRLKDDLLAALLDLVEPEAIDRIYFTEFTVN
jgi:flagellar protein FliL